MCGKKCALLIFFLDITCSQTVRPELKVVKSHRLYHFTTSAKYLVALEFLAVCFRVVSYHATLPASHQ